MSTFEIYPGRLDTVCLKYGNAGMTAHRIAEEIESVMKSLRLGSNSGAESVRSALKDSAASVERFSERSIRIQNCLSSAAEWYRNAENTVSGTENGMFSAEIGLSGGMDVSDHSIYEELASVILKSSDAGNLLVGILGPSYGIFKGLNILHEPDPGAWNKGISELVIHLMEMKAGDKYNSFYDCAMDYLGLAKYSEDIIVPNGSVWDNFSDYLNDEIEKYGLSAFRNGGLLEKTKVTAKWLDIGLEFYMEAAENLEEGNSAVRTVSEIMIESSVDIGLDLILGAGFAAAAGTFGAPVIVGGLAAGVTAYAANSLCEWAFNKDIGEIVSDTLCDGAEKLGNAIGDGLYDLTEKVKEEAEDLKKAGREACRTVSSWWKDLTGG